MASSNRHWPSMFKSKPCNTQQWQPHHDINPCARSPFSSGGEERSPEPKPRWNPRPEQIQILESIFNSGLVNPPRDEIRRIRAQLQEYGEVGDANVFYWFQNRKSRSKHKNRSKMGSPATAPRSQQRPMISASSSNSSTTSSDKASPKKQRAATPTNNNIDINITRNINNNNGNNNNSNNNVVVDQFVGINNSPTSVNQCCSYFQPSHDQFGGHQEPIFFPLQQSGASVLNGGGFSPGLGLGFGHDPISNTGFSNLLLGEDVEKLKFQQELGFFFTNSSNNSCLLPTSNSCGIISTNLGQVIGVGESGGVAGKSTVFVDNMMIEVPSGSFHVREYFGEDAILVYPSGHPVVTNEWGVTVNPLQNGACYYILRPTIAAASPLLDKLDTNPDLLEPEFPYQI